MSSKHVPVKVAVKELADGNIEAAKTACVEAYKVPGLSAISVFVKKSVDGLELALRSKSSLEE